MKKKLILYTIFLFSFLLLGSVVIDAQHNETIRVAPVNPAFLRYLQEFEMGQVRMFTDDGHPLGDIPSIIDLSHVRFVRDRELDMVFPSSYSLITLGRVTSVKDQGTCGSCWSFATYGSMESYLMGSTESFLMLGEERDFAEQHLIENHGFDLGECSGGNTDMATAYLTRWDGPKNESDYPYEYSSAMDLQATQKKVHQVVYLPSRSGPLDNDVIKGLVTTYGAVYISMCWNSGASYYNTTTHAYYYNGSAGTNHGVCIVGWDDNYSASNFDITPPGNGAFIIKNSWGTGWGDNGYFYMSYYDTKLTPRAIFNNAEDPSIYDTNYQYDPLGWVSSYGYGSTTAHGANIFTATGDEVLKAAGFYTNDNNTGVTIYIYTNVIGSTDPKNGTLAATKTASFTYPGYYTVELDSPVSLTNGQQFSVVVKFENTSYGWPVACEEVAGGYSSGATAGSGESFLSLSGSGWTDMGTSFGANVCIKAYAGVAGPEMNVSGYGRNFLDGATINAGTRNVEDIVGKVFKLTIENTGTSNLELTGFPKVTISGPEGNGFTVTQQPVSPVTPGGSTIFRFKTKKDTVPPLPVGWERAISFTINIANNDADENPYTFDFNVTLKKY